ncbi:unnamed protein product [Somion occarium]|uniref:Uncharacterized protein n=1 Tax=Somion occarium TaxID=3059160 RepID=A0ABP1DF98_9APHY
MNAVLPQDIVEQIIRRVYPNMILSTGLSRDTQVKTKGSGIMSTIQTSWNVFRCCRSTCHSVTDGMAMAELSYNSLLHVQFPRISSFEIRSFNLPHTEKDELLCYLRTRFPFLTSLSIRDSGISLDELNSLIKSFPCLSSLFLRKGPADSEDSSRLRRSTP